MAASHAAPGPLLLLRRQIPASQLAVSQSLSLMHFWFTRHLFAQEPPQSTSVSLPF
ncbi:hypothetical protein WMF31_36545 [Sorangium sp. So ce1036]|uniref:hypothetical protein n=1 Tax=Sorangium sp. So ce1036 TaxID=3133328 RepID=UPI003F0FB262